MAIADIVARGHALETVQRIEHLLYIAEYKRRQLAPGVKITAKQFAGSSLSRHKPVSRPMNYPNFLGQNARWLFGIFCSRFLSFDKPLLFLLGGTDRIMVCQMGNGACSIW